ncbi:MAG: hypothetical protein IPI75_02275 [Gammaproteobacteria bacterium]|nr:hypothetical protein [Gammaproteobacteria bacterium]
MSVRVQRLAFGACAFAVAGMLVASGVSHAQVRFYRYQNADGVTVIDDRVPPQFAQKGYAILDSNGRVVEVVPRALTEAERRESDSTAVKERLRAEEAERQKRYDIMLLGRYSSVEDIEAAELRKVNEIKVRINLLNANIAGLKKQLEVRQAEAAEIERSGQPVPPELPATLESLRAEIAENARLIGRHEQERETTETRFRYDIDRFKLLHPPRAPAEPVAVEAGQAGG